MRRNKFYAGASLAALLIFSPILHAEDSSTPPPAKKKKLKWLQDLSANADSSSSPPATIAGVRGLEDVGAAPDTSVRDFAAIDRLDALKVSETDLKTFVDEGKLR